VRCTPVAFVFGERNYRREDFSDESAAAASLVNAGSPTEPEARDRNFRCGPLLFGEVFEKTGVDDVAERAFRRHYGDVYRYLRRRTGDHHRAEDLTQQVFVDAVVSLRETESPTLAWLYTVAQRRFIDEVRRNAVGQRLAALQPVASERDYGPNVTAALRASIARLPEGQRDVLVLKLLRGARFAEIGAKLDVTPAAAKMRFMRALEALQDDLELEGVGP
jgi:RNA polymerase sigma factor (sigma-70 family)